MIVSSFLPNETDLSWGSKFYEEDTDRHVCLQNTSFPTEGAGGLGVDRKVCKPTSYFAGFVGRLPFTYIFVKFDLTYEKPWYLSGKYVTIAKLSSAPLELAEIRVYGSKFC